ncbi:MAG: class I SAM-dependent methyltransferase [Vicinamibacterales bacterium]
MQLSALKRHWERLGRQDPFWAVLTDPTKRDGAWDLEQFYRSGIDELTAVLDHAQQLGLTVSRERALDFGCGTGRMTQAMAAAFERADGVDISTSMLETARRHNRHADRCVYHHNLAPNLALFAEGTFSFVFTTLVLQHMDPRYAKAYIRELVRVLRPSGLLVFQVPSHRTATEPRSSESHSHAAQPLPDEACRADLRLEDQLPIDRSSRQLPSVLMKANEERTLRVRVENRSAHVWPGVPAARSRHQINLANHWLDEAGSVVRRDDGRCPLPHDLPPGSHVELLLGMQAPPFNGTYFVELDLVQENVGWFAESGSRTVRIRCEVTGGMADPGPRPLASPATPPEPLFRERHPRVFRVLYATGLRDLYWNGRRAIDRVKARRDRLIRRRVHPFINWWLGRPFEAKMEMHCVPRSEVLALLGDCGARVVDTQAELVAGGFQSYRYWVTKDKGVEGRGAIVASR